MSSGITNFGMSPFGSLAPVSRQASSVVATPDQLRDDLSAWQDWRFRAYQNEAQDYWGNYDANKADWVRQNTGTLNHLLATGNSEAARAVQNEMDDYTLRGATWRPGPDPGASWQADAEGRNAQYAADVARYGAAQPTLQQAYDAQQGGGGFTGGLMGAPTTAEPTTNFGMGTGTGQTPPNGWSGAAWGENPAASPWGSWTGGLMGQGGNGNSQGSPWGGPFGRPNSWGLAK